MKESSYVTESSCSVFSFFLPLPLSFSFLFVYANERSTKEKVICLTHQDAHAEAETIFRQRVREKEKTRKSRFESRTTAEIFISVAYTSNTSSSDEFSRAKATLISSSFTFEPGRIRGDENISRSRSLISGSSTHVYSPGERESERIFE